MEKGELKPLTQILKIIPENMDGKMWIEQGFSRQTALETAETDTETAKIAVGTCKIRRWDCKHIANPFFQHRRSPTPPFFTAFRSLERVKIIPSMNSHTAQR